MKVLMISRKFGPLGTMSFGPFSMVYKLVKGLNEKIDISILSSHLGLPTKENVEGISVYRTFFPPIDDLTKWFFMPHVIFENGIVKKIFPDILHSQDIEGGIIFKKYRSTKMKKVFAIKSSISFRSKSKERNPEYGLKHRIYFRTIDFWERIAINNADFFITPTIFLRNEMIEHYRLDESRFFRIMNGTFTDLFRPETDVSKIKKKLGIKNERVLFSTSAGWRKGLDALLKAFNIIKKSNPNTKLIIAGRSKLDVFEKFVDPKVVDKTKDIILVGNVSNYDFPMYYNLADLFLLPSYMETQPNTLIESLSCGTPVVTFKSGGCPELVSKKEGVLVEVGDVEDFAHTTINLLDNKTKLRKLGIECRERALRDYRIEKIVDEHIKMYEQIIE